MFPARRPKGIREWAAFLDSPSRLAAPYHMMIAGAVAFTSGVVLAVVFLRPGGGDQRTFTLSSAFVALGVLAIVAGFLGRPWRRTKIR